MYKITLCCNAGMSTSMLVKKMQAAAAEQNIDATIEAHPVNKFEEIIPTTDVVLLGPQVRFKLKEFRQSAVRYDKPVEAIDPASYGAMNGAKVLQLAINAIEGN